MTRRIPNLLSLLQISREQAAIALAAGAVACLSSAIVRWSYHYPAQTSSVEGSLFGDLTETEGAEITVAQQVMAPSEARPPAIKDHESLRGKPGDLRQQLPLTPEIPSGEARVTTVQFSQPPQESAAPVSEEQTAAAWLSGQIESTTETAEADDPSAMHPLRRPPAVFR